MRNLTRPATPPSLRDNASDWTDDLLAAIDSDEVTNTISGRYRQDDVRDALIEMYNGCCCFCESHIGNATYERIEHRKPKAPDKFPEHAFDWDNLHLCCEICNTNKGSKWDHANPILDAVTDVPIWDHLRYENDRALGLMYVGVTDRGETTIDHTDLNRGYFKGLPGARAQMLIAVLNTLFELERAEKNDLNSKLRKRLKAELRKKAKGEYGSVIEWALRELDL